MLIKNASIFNGISFVRQDVEFEDSSGLITAVGDLAGRGLDARGKYVTPGFIDIHTHGGGGYDFSDGSKKGLERLSLFYARHGVTTFLATSMTLDEPALTRAMNTARDFIPPYGVSASCAGVNLEGPFINPAMRGAQAARSVRLPDIGLFSRLNEASGNRIKLVTIAPEQEGGLEFIREASKYCAVSLGHTDAGYDCAREAFENGANHLTHTFNRMPQLLHRDPGPIAAAAECEAYAELVCDGLHVHPAMVRLAFELFGKKLCLISDSIRCADMPDGEYELGGQPVTVANGRVVLKGTGTLAGSSLTLLNAVKNAVSFGIPLEQAVYAASTAPANSIGLNDAGSIAVGKSADLLLLNDALELEAVFIGGKKLAL